MKVILIDPSKNLIEMIDVTSDWTDVDAALSSAQDLIGAKEIESIYTKLDGYDAAVLIDANDPSEKRFSYFAMAGVSIPIRGRAIVIGPHDREGNPTPFDGGLIVLASNIDFISSNQVMMHAILGIKTWRV